MRCASLPLALLPLLLACAALAPGAAGLCADDVVPAAVSCANEIKRAMHGMTVSGEVDLPWHLLFGCHFPNKL